ncbi:hypothetical protein Cni_G20076 [Canna indica]|uniref:Arabinanase/levansucrase/invertase n=1 Tax=Canna indica TaxID=4628 RepID=A0AAQ3KN72_9LILI|nr:hypothetical protein Cni_G20076 [Canna indica]
MAMTPSLLLSLSFSTNNPKGCSFPDRRGRFTTRSAPLPFSTPAASASSRVGMVFDIGPACSWDSRDIGSPVVKRYLGDDEERWLMWYHGSGEDADGDSIGMAVSKDGIHWKRGAAAVSSSDDVGQVMLCSSDWWAFDTSSIRPSEVLIMSSDKLTASGAVYWLYYTGFNQEKLDVPGEGAGDISRPQLMSLPGLAISQDGRYWARIEGEHHSGALFDVGSEGEWDSLYVASPQVVYHGRGDLRMYYHSFDQRNMQYAIGIARSGDGIRWVKLGKVLCGGAARSFDQAGVRNAHVVRNQKDGSYLMVYEGVSMDGRIHIGLAASSDGLKDWRRCRDEAIFKPSTHEEGWDNRGVSAPCLLQVMDGGREEWRLYYTGIGKNGRTSIGMAVSEGPEISNFNRWV